MTNNNLMGLLDPRFRRQDEIAQQGILVSTTIKNLGTSEASLSPSLVADFGRLLLARP